MRSEDFSLLTMASIIWIFNSRATSVLSVDPYAGITAKSNDPSTKSSSNLGHSAGHTVGRSMGHDFDAEKNLDSTAEDRSDDVLTCLMKRLYDANGGGQSDGCYRRFWLSWEPTGDVGGDDGIIKGRRKSKKKLTLDVMTLMLGAAIKLILFLPILAVLTGKAISLSLTSLLITSLAFLHKTQ